ncbi:hypothetical protein N657DRAFT_673524 [Parathielavia appendiculata]|uniref:Uncharacterized protein n=1 Tax=Parathielavia appendiculata TaxID=2587402 RepID=A0AAN6Z229_9PEZI|nr:hypothetical protein N657DRAFT_673524 [Parathielavia appendiculata]
MHMLAVAGQLAARGGDTSIHNKRHSLPDTPQPGTPGQAATPCDEAVDDIGLDDVNALTEKDDGGDTAEAAGPANSGSDSSTPRPTQPGTLKASIPEAIICPLPWSILSMFPHTSDIPSLAPLDDDEAVEDTELGQTNNSWLFARLVKRQTHPRHDGRPKRMFRERCGLGVISDHRSKDDVLEMLGFLTGERVRVLTEKALADKEQEKGS